MITHAGGRPSSEYVTRYTSPKCSEVGAIVHGSEDGRSGRGDRVLYRREQFILKEIEDMDTISVNQYACDVLYYVLISRDESDGWYSQQKISVEN